MKKHILELVGCMLLCTALTACTQEQATLSGILFDRGHGSAWGNQFYIEVYPEEIAVMRHFPNGAQEQTVSEHIPITAEQWQQLTEAIENLQLQKKSTPWWKKLFTSSRQDDGEYRNLTLGWETGGKTAQTAYQWPQSTQANALEALLEQFAATAAQANSPADWSDAR